MNSEYIKMVLALPEEFFERWEWKAGDRVLHKLEYSDEWKTEFILDNGIAYIISLNKGNVWGKYIPLPSQEQLQEKCMALINCDARDLLRFFEAWVYEDELRPVVSFADFNELWLKYTIWVWGRKEWNGEAWI